MTNDTYSLLFQSLIFSEFNLKKVFIGRNKPGIDENINRTRRTAESRVLLPSLHEGRRVHESET